MDRERSLQNLARREEPWDIAVIGGGATGVGIAVDAAARGYSVCLFEQSDFGKGTSSRSTKLVHGGVRYLQQGNLSLVMEALKERGILRANAPHLVHDLPFIVPNYAWWEAPFYGVGLKVYDLLAFRHGFSRSHLLSKAEVLAHIPTLETDKLRGGVIYFDGQFDDARLLINLCETAIKLNAVLMNYAPVVELTRSAEGKIDGVIFTDAETGGRDTVRARCVINACGVFGDAVRKLDEPAAAPIISPSQGVHIVLDRAFLPGDAAIMVPRTSDGRVMFAIPWLGRVLIGTTDTPVSTTELEPIATDAEIDFLLSTASQYLTRHPTRADILSVFAGVRPLVKPADDAKTSAVSRDHTIEISASGLITIAGGKWTTYRKMAEDCVNRAADLAGLPAAPCMTESLHVHGYHERPTDLGELGGYGADAAEIESLAHREPAFARRLHASLPITTAMVIWAVRREMARTVEDVLSRRTRVLLLDARAAIEIAPDVAAVMAAELQKNRAWQQSQVAKFTRLAEAYVVRGK